MIQKNDIVVFGRPNGEKTRGRVIRVNAKSITIEQVEERGQMLSALPFPATTALTEVSDG